MFTGVCTGTLLLIFENGIKRLPSKMYKTDFDSKWCSNPLYDVDTTHKILDETLRNLYFKNIKLDSIEDPPIKKRISENSIRLKLSNYKSKVHKECTRKMRTNVFCKAKAPLESDTDLVRLEPDDYDEKSQWKIPKEYFIKDGNGYKYKNVSDIEKIDDKKVSWPQKTKRDIDSLTNQFKCSVLIVAKNLHTILESLRDSVFQDDKRIYMGSIKCDKTTYDTLKNLYEYNLETLMEEVIDWCHENSKESRNDEKGRKSPTFEVVGPRLDSDEESWEDMAENMQNDQDEYDKTCYRYDAKY